MKAKIKKGKILFIPETKKENAELHQYFEAFDHCGECGGGYPIRVKWINCPGYGTIPDKEIKKAWKRDGLKRGWLDK